MTSPFSTLLELAKICTLGMHSAKLFLSSALALLVPVTILPVMKYHEWQINYVIRCPSEQPTGLRRTPHSELGLFCICIIHTPRRSLKEVAVCRLLFPSRGF